MVVGPERIDQTSLKSQASKPFKGLSPIGVKKDGSNLPAHNSGGQGLVSHSPNVIPAEPTPPKSPPPVRRAMKLYPITSKYLLPHLRDLLFKGVPLWVQSSVMLQL